LPLTTKRKQTTALLSKTRKPLNVIHGNDRFTMFNKDRGDPVDRRNAVVDNRPLARQAFYNG